MSPKKKARKTARRAPRAAGKTAKKKVSPIPRGYHVATPYIVVRDCARALDFYKRAFGAKERGGRMTTPAGKIMHAEMVIGDSAVMLSDEFPEMGSRAPESLGGIAGGILLYVRNSDKVFDQAVAAGARPVMPLADQFWGDRYGKLLDPFGQEWGIATHVADLTPRQMRKAAEEAMAQASAGGPRA